MFHMSVQFGLNESADIRRGLFTEGPRLLSVPMGGE